MKREIQHQCDGCQKDFCVEISSDNKIVCPHCSKSWLAQATEIFFEHCSFCRCRQFYVKKDFNQALGCLIMVIGISLVPVTYGLSLVFFSALDWLLYRRVKDVIVCYQCGAGFKGFGAPEHLKPFLHHIGEKYERLREKKTES